MNPPLPATHLHVSPSDDAPLLIKQVRALVNDLLEPRLRIYWMDLLITLTLGLAGFFLFLKARHWPSLRVVGFLLAGFAFYRASAFTHELSHHRFGPFRTFRIVWNLLCGIPLLTPSFLYGDHKSHHVNHSYGTPEDAEYLPLSTRPLVGLLGFFVQIFVVPLLNPIRFVVLAPLSWLIPPLRRVVWERLSAIGTINWWNYRRAEPDTAAERREALIQEIGCFLFGIGLIALIWRGSFPGTMMLQLYALLVFITAINYLRALAAHRYLSEGREQSYFEQLMDSITVPGHPLWTELWAPVGLRYHSLHHLVPSIPYHNLGIAHRRLMTSLPPDSPYRATIHCSLVDALGVVIRDICRGGRPLVEDHPDSHAA